MEQVSVRLPEYPQLFGGAGFHNNDATLYHIIDPEFFRQAVCKDYREISPGFMRTFAGFDDWTKEAMDEFAEYYEQMQKWTDTPMYLTAGNGKRHFSEKEMEDYCERVAQKLDYLYHEKSVRHIRYYCFSNEMSCGMWGVLLDDLPRFKQYHVYLYRAFARHNLPVGLLATDASGYKAWSTMDYVAANMADITEDYCFHIYEQEHGIHDLQFYDFFYKKCREVVEKAIGHFGKRVILGEIGIQKNDGGHLHFNGNVILDVCRYFEDPYEEAYCALMLTEMMFAAINAGIFQMAIWTFLDHPDPYSCAYSTGDDYARRWGEAEHFFSCTMDTKYNRWGFLPWEGKEGPRALYYCIAFLMKLFKKNSKVLECSADDPELRMCGIMNRDGSVSIGIVNRGKSEKTICLQSSLFKKDIRAYVYDPARVRKNRFGDLPAAETVIPMNAPEYTIRPESVVFLTTDYLDKAGHVYADGVKVSEGRLIWNAVSNPDHCYYRVFAGKDEDFVPAFENQIASTVAEELPIDDADLYYRVLSVDKSGNI